MHAVVRCPAIEEDTQWQADSTRNCQEHRETVLRLRVALSLVLLDVFVGHGTQHAHSNDHTNAHTKIRETDSARGEVILAFEDKSHGCEEQVQDTVVDGDVQGHQKYDGREEQHLHWARDGAYEDLFGRETVVELGAKVHVAGLLLEALDLIIEDSLVESLTAEEGEGDAKGATEDGEDVEDPAPRERLNKETTADGTNDRAEKRSHGVDGHGAGTLFRREHVCNCATSKGQRRGTSAASK